MYALSTGDTDDKLSPVRVQGLADVKIVQVSCGVATPTHGAGQ